jgi:hypothetical protein
VVPGICFWPSWRFAAVCCLRTCLAHTSTAALQGLGPQGQHSVLVARGRRGFACSQPQKGFLSSSLPPQGWIKGRHGQQQYVRAFWKGWRRVTETMPCLKQALMGDDTVAGSVPHCCTQGSKLARHAIIVCASTLKGTMQTCRLCVGANKSTFVNGLKKGQCDIKKPLASAADGREDACYTTAALASTKALSGSNNCCRSAPPPDSHRRATCHR